MICNCAVEEDSWWSLGLQGDPTSQSILKDISSEYSLEGLMLKLKLQYFGHLMRRIDSFEKTLMLRKIEGRRRRGWQRMRWLDCKTQNSGLRSKEEKPRHPINQSSRCNTQEGLLSVEQTGWLWSPGRQSTSNSKLGKLFIGKKTPYYQHITYGLQSDWLHVCKAILLVQTSRAFVQT